MKVGQKKLFVTLACLLSLVFLVGSASANLVANGDFEAGNTGFSSGYTYVSTPGDYALWDESTYAVGNNPRDYHLLWSSFTPQDGSKMMMIVNGATSGDVTVWEQTSTVAVTPGIKYYFSAWAAASYPSNPAALAFSVNNTPLWSPFSTTMTPGEWKQFTAFWTPDPGVFTAKLSLVNSITAASGNDFSLDNIQFDAVPLPPSVLLLGSGLMGLGLLRRKWSLKK